MLLLVGRIAFTCGIDSSAACSKDWIVPHAPQWISDAAYHVQGLDFIREAIVVFLASEMQFADQVDGQPLIAYFMVPGTFASTVREGVVPIPYFVDVLASGQ